MIDPWLDAFRFTMHLTIKEIARRHWQELSRKIHFTARSNGQRRRQERERREREINELERMYEGH